MGWGDELLAAGQARRAQQADQRRVQILDVAGAARWHAIWNGNPRIARIGETGDFQRITNGPNARPYIASKTAQRWTWKPFEPTPGEIFFTDIERAFAAPYRPQVVVEPTVKAKASPNKQWPIQHWQRFVRLAKEAGIELTQIGPHGSRILPGVNFILTTEFRLACAVLANARAYVGHEGGMHHAAAALGVPAVVIFGGFISPAQTGYPTHRNLFTGGEACGMRVQCKHCADAMAAIKPEAVLDELRAIL